MWSIGRVKKRAWEFLKKSYWTAFLISVITMFAISNSGAKTPGGIQVMAAISQISFLSQEIIEDSIDEYEYDDFENQEINETHKSYDSLFGDEDEESVSAGAHLFFIAIVIYYLMIVLLALAFKIFFLGPLEVGCRRYFSRSMRDGESDLNEVSFGFKKGTYFKSVLGILLRDFYLFLWGVLPTVLFILIISISSVENHKSEYVSMLILAIVSSSIAAIVLVVKSYSYALVPYLLSEDESVGARKAIKMSRSLMKGNKFQLFLLQLSFIGWFALGVLVFFVGVIFVQPYYQMAMGAFYEEIREIGIRDGVM